MGRIHRSPIIRGSYRTVPHRCPEVGMPHLGLTPSAAHRNPDHQHPFPILFTISALTKATESPPLSKPRQRPCSFPPFSVAFQGKMITTTTQQLTSSFKRKKTIIFPPSNNQKKFHSTPPGQYSMTETSDKEAKLLSGPAATEGQGSTPTPPPCSLPVCSQHFPCISLPLAVLWPQGEAISRTTPIENASHQEQGTASCTSSFQAGPRATS